MSDTLKNGSDIFSTLGIEIPDDKREIIDANWNTPWKQRWLQTQSQNTIELIASNTWLKFQNFIDPHTGETKQIDSYEDLATKLKATDELISKSGADASIKVGRIIRRIQVDTTVDEYIQDPTDQENQIKNGKIVALEFSVVKPLWPIMTTQSMKKAFDMIQQEASKDNEGVWLTELGSITSGVRNIKMQQVLRSLGYPAAVVSQHTTLDTDSKNGGAIDFAMYAHADNDPYPAIENLMEHLQTPHPDYEGQARIDVLNTLLKSKKIQPTVRNLVEMGIIDTNQPIAKLVALLEKIPDIEVLDEGALFHKFDSEGNLIKFNPVLHIQHRSKKILEA